MGVLIPGEKKPIVCCKKVNDHHQKIFCPFWRATGHCAFQGIHGEYDISDYYQHCPLIEVPEPHGELIDRSRLLRPEILPMYYHLPNGDTAIPIIDIKHAPTVIPASEVQSD